MTAPGAPRDGDVGITDVIEAVRAWLQILWAGRRLVVHPVAVATAVGLIVALGSRQEFTSGMRLLPYRGAGQGSGSLSGLAGLAGLRLPSGLSDQIITADLYPVIAKTIDFRISVAETPLRFAPGDEPIKPATYLLEHRSIPARITDLLSDARAKATSIVTGDTGPAAGIVSGADNTPMQIYSRRYLRVVEELDARLQVAMDRKTSVITIRGTMPTRYAATDLVQTVSNRLMQRIIEYEARKAGEQLAFIEEQHSKSRARYEKAQRNLAEFVDRNRILTSAVSQIERDRLQREFDVEFAVLQQLTTELQQARIKQTQDTPVFTVLEQALVPTTRSSPRRTFLVLMSIGVGLAAGILQILWAYYRPART